MPKARKSRPTIKTKKLIIEGYDVTYNAALMSLATINSMKLSKITKVK